MVKKVKRDSDIIGIVIIFILLIIILGALIYLIYSNYNLNLVVLNNNQNSSSNSCDYNSSSKTYFNKDVNCTINFLCVKDSLAFKDKCGCGCEVINQTLDNTQEVVAADCDSHQVEDCPDKCVVCPPCAACSSLSCKTKEFCLSIGFDETWYKSLRR